MARATTKAELIASAGGQWEKLWNQIEGMDEGLKTAVFSFGDNAGKKEAHWRRDKNLRDALVCAIKHPLYICAFSHSFSIVRKEKKRGSTEVPLSSFCLMLFFYKNMDKTNTSPSAGIALAGRISAIPAMAQPFIIVTIPPTERKAALLASESKGETSPPQKNRVSISTA